MNARKLKQELRARANQYHGRFVDISEVEGIPYNWLVKFASGAMDNPRIESLHKLEQALDGWERRMKPKIKEAE